MKIFYIADAVIPSRTANGVHIMKMCQAFASNGHEITLLLPNRVDDDLKIKDIYDFYSVKKCFKIIRIPYPKIIGGVFIFSLLSILKSIRERTNLVYTRFLYASFLGLFFSLPTILEVHSSEFITKIDKVAFSWIAKNKLGKIVVISQALKNILANKYKVSRNKILVAPDGADPVNNIKPRKLKKKSGQLMIGYVGHLYKGRGIDIIAELAKLCPWAEFHIIGGLPQDVDYWKKELLKLQNIILYGHVPHKEVYEFMLSFDALIAPYQEKVSVYGGIGDTAKWMSPLKIFEYMATGKTILASDLPVLREILKNNQNSLLAFPRDIEKWKLNLERIKNNGNLRNKLGKKAKEDFKNNYTWKSRAKKVLKLLQ